MLARKLSMGIGESNQLANFEREILVGIYLKEIEEERKAMENVGKK